MLKKWLIYALRFALIFIAVMMIAWAALYLYFRSHKAEILEKTTTIVKSKVHGDVVIKNIGLDFPRTFPYVSIVLENITVRDSLYNIHHHDLLQAEKLLLLLNPFKLITGKLTFSKIQVEHGSIYLYEDSTGAKSTDALIVENNKKNSQSTSISSARLIDMKFSIDKLFKNKLFAFQIKNLATKITDRGSQVNFKGRIDLFVQSMAFNLNKGSFAEKKPLAGNFEFKYDTASHTLGFSDVKLLIEDEPYVFTGRFKLNEGKNYNLQINAPKANFSKAASLMPYNIRRNIDSIEFDKPLAVDASINGHMISGSKPVVKVNWMVKDTRIATNSGIFNHTSFDGFFYNAVSDTLPHIGENSVLQFNHFSSNWEGVNLHSKSLAIHNLKKPFLTCDLTAKTELEKLNDLLDIASIEFGKGTFNANVTYKGPIYDSATEAPDIYGSATIRDAAILYGPRQVHMNEFNGDLIFKGPDVYFNDVKTIAEGNTVSFNVVALNVLALMNNDPSKAQLNATVYSPSIDISRFTSFLGGRKKGLQHKKKRSLLYNISGKIDNLLDQCSILSSISADRISFKRFTATALKTNIALSNDSWNISNTSLNHAGGTIKMDGYIHGGSNNYNPIKVNAVLHNLDIAKTFYAFNNFGLTSLSSKNLDGRLSSTVKLTAALLDKAEIVPSTLKGSVTLSLKDGGINNWEPLENMSIFLLKKRDFSHVSFSEIKNRFDFNGQMININRMEIESNVLSLFMEGLYDIGAKATDLVLQVPLSNLKKRDPDYVPENKGVNSKTGPSVYIKLKNKPGGDIDYSFSLFNSRKRLVSK